MDIKNVFLTAAERVAAQNLDMSDCDLNEFCERNEFILNDCTCHYAYDSAPVGVFGTDAY